MKRQTLARMLLACMPALALGACVDHLGIEVGNHTNNYIENTDYLCSRAWVEEWYDSQDTYYYQELNFYADQSGEDYMYVQDRFGGVQETRYTFRWDWYNSMYTSLRLTYGAGDYSYLDNMVMGGNRLTGVLDGYPVDFLGR